MPGWNSYANTGVVTGLAYLVIFPSWLSYLLWNKGISAIGATRGIYSHLIPLSGGLFSVIFLHVTLHSYHLVSALVNYVQYNIVFTSEVQKPQQRVA